MIITAADFLKYRSEKLKNYLVMFGLCLSLFAFLLPLVIGTPYISTAFADPFTVIALALIYIQSVFTFQPDDYSTYEIFVKLKNGEVASCVYSVDRNIPLGYEIYKDKTGLVRLASPNSPVSLSTPGIMGARWKVNPARNMYQGANITTD